MSELANVIRHPIIVLDGPDGSGKTTLGEALVKELGAKYVHLTYRWGSKMNLYHEAALFYILREAENRPVVLDRWWMSELVYANVYRGGSKWPLLYRMLDGVAIRHAITYVMCRPVDRDAYVDHFKELKSRREEMYSDNMEKVYDGYRDLEHKLKNQHHPNLITYDWMENKDQAAFTKRMMDIIHFASDRRWDNIKSNRIPHTYRNISGSFDWAEYLIVGDAANDFHRREMWPFFNYDGSDLWVHECLERLEIPTHKILMMNSFHRFQHVTDSYLRQAQERNLKIISMGNMAYAHLKGLGIQSHYLSHPKFTIKSKLGVEAGFNAMKEAFK